MFQLSYKAGWSKEHQVFGVYNTKDEARKAARSIPRKPKIWSIRVEEINGITVVDLDDPAVLHSAIKTALGE